MVSIDSAGQVDSSCTNTKGVLYIATGEEYAQEAKRSAQSLITHNNLETTLLSDKIYGFDVFDNEEVVKYPRYDKGDSIPNYDQIPYDRTLLLDSDTYVCGNIESVFQTLDHFDMGCTLNSGLGIKYENLDHEQDLDLPQPPDSFYEFNTGVVLLRRNNNIKSFLEQWKKIYCNQTSFTRNQPAFRQALYMDNLRFFTLPKSYNYHLPRLGYVDGEIKILHGRHPCSFQSVEKCVNKTSQRRVITKTGWPMGVITRDDLSAEFKIKYNLKNNGVVGSIKKLLSKLI